MPQLDRLYDLFVSGTGTAEQVWASHAFGSGLATVGQQIDRGGILYSPLSTVVLRVRYRTDINVESRWRDRDGRVWRTNEWLEVGRRRWLDVSISTYDLPTAEINVAAWPAGRQPVGWNLQWRAGSGVRDVPAPAQYVAELVIGNTLVDSDGQRLFDVVIQAPGWAVAEGLDLWLDPPAGGIDATVAGTTLTSFGLAADIDRATAARVDANELDSGGHFPTVQGASFMAHGSGFAPPVLATGQILQIAER